MLPYPWLSSAANASRHCSQPRDWSNAKPGPPNMRLSDSKWLDDAVLRWATRLLEHLNSRTFYPCHLPSSSPNHFFCATLAGQCLPLPHSWPCDRRYACCPIWMVSPRKTFIESEVCLHTCSTFCPDNYIPLLHGLWDSPHNRRWRHP